MVRAALAVRNHRFVGNIPGMPGVARRLLMLIGDYRALRSEALDGYRDVGCGDVGWDW